MLRFSRIIDGTSIAEKEQIQKQSYWERGLLLPLQSTWTFIIFRFWGTPK
jgi:hypothetical protein